MKKSILKQFLLWAFFIGTIVTFATCQKASINGDLDGRWQMMQLEIDDEYENVASEQLYYNFYMHVCNLSYYGGVFTEGNMKFENDVLWLQFPYIKTELGIENLKKYGIFSNPVQFRVEYLDNKKLILKEGDIVITLRKF